MVGLGVPACTVLEPAFDGQPPGERRREHRAERRPFLGNHTGDARHGQVFSPRLFTTARNDPRLGFREKHWRIELAEEIWGELLRKRVKTRWVPCVRCGRRLRVSVAMRVRGVEPACPSSDRDGWRGQVASGLADRADA